MAEDNCVIDISADLEFTPINISGNILDDILQAKINGYNNIEIIAGDNIVIEQEENKFKIGAKSEVSLDYNNLINKPSINDIVLEGNKVSKELGLQDKMTALSNMDIENILKGQA